jgi:hypothetical protein
MTLFVLHLVYVELQIFRFLPIRFKGGCSLDPCNKVTGVLFPILNHHDAFSEGLQISMLRSMLSNLQRKNAIIFIVQQLT